MFNIDDITNGNKEDHNKKWLYIPDYPYRTLIIGGSGWGKTCALLNLIKIQDSDNLIDEIYWYAKELNEPKYQVLIKKPEDVLFLIKHLNDPKAFIEYSAYMDDVYNNIDDYNTTRNIKISIVFVDMILWIIKDFKP